MIATKTPTVEEFLRSGDNERSEYAQGEKWEKLPANKDHASLHAQLGSALVGTGVKVEPVLRFHPGITASGRNTTSGFMYLISRLYVLLKTLSFPTMGIALPTW